MGLRRLRQHWHCDAQRLQPEERQDGSRTQLGGLSVVTILAHVAGIPLEETLAMAVPVFGASCAAILASLSSARRRRAERGDRRRSAA